MKRYLTSFLLACTVGLVPLATFADETPDPPDPPQSQESGAKAKKEKKEVRQGLHLEAKNGRPSLRAGDWLRTDFRLWFMHDFRSYDPEITGDEGDVAMLRRFRLGLEGYVTRDFEYQVEAEIRNEIGDLFNLRTNTSEDRFRDVYGNWRYFRRFQVRAGHFKIPFGRDQLNSLTNSEFVTRSLIGVHLSPGRDIGVMLHGKFFDQRLEYQAGLFKQDGRRAELPGSEPSGERTFAGRVAGVPFQFLPSLGRFNFLKSLELGTAFTDSPITEGMRSVRGRTWSGTHNFFDRIFARGHRLRNSIELTWTPGPFSVRGEMIRVRDERLGQGVRGDDLPDLIARGWYLSTSWVVTGQSKSDNVVPRGDVMMGRGFGALELAARYEQLRFTSAEHPGNPSRSIRAPNIAAASERVATFATIWYLNRHAKVHFDVMREVLEDPERFTIRGVDTYWSRIVRIQFTL